jgi:plastocyanin
VKEKAMSMFRNPASKRSGLLLAAFAAGALLAAASPGAGAAGQATVTTAASPAAVEINNFKFMPATLTVVAGTTVTWTNDDTSPHTVTEQNKVFHSAALDTKDTFSYQFAAPGEYVYHCSIHPMMVGRIIVKPAGKSS